MITLSLCMIVKNESDVLARCLSSAAGIADEIIIVDTGSEDGTKEIAGQFTTKVYDFPWRDDFAAARNFSFSKAAMEYTMWLDADDVIDEENRRLLLALKEELSPEVDMVLLRYDVAFDEQDRPTFSYYRERIVRTAGRCRWVGQIHEVIPQRGVVEHRDISIRHRKLRPAEPGRNLRIFQRMLAEGKVLDPRMRQPPSGTKRRPPARPGSRAGAFAGPTATATFPTCSSASATTGWAGGNGRPSATKRRGASSPATKASFTTGPTSKEPPRPKAGNRGPTGGHQRVLVSTTLPTI